MGRSDPKFDGIINLGVHHTPVVPKEMVSFVFRADVDIFRPKNPALDVREEVSHLLDIINNSGFLVGSATDEEPAHNIRLHLEMFPAGNVVHPYHWKLLIAPPVVSPVYRKCSSKLVAEKGQYSRFADVWDLWA